MTLDIDVSYIDSGYEMESPTKEKEMDIEDEMAMHETNRWEIKELVLEMISDAFEYSGRIVQP